MADLIDREKLFQDLREHNIPFNAYVNEALIVAPAVDAVEVVRCKDCKWCKPINNEVRGFYKNCMRHEIAVYDDGFCAWGERRENNA